MPLVWEDVDFVSPATFPPGSWVDEFEMLHVFFSQEYLSTSGICSWVRGLWCYVLFFPESPATREWPWLHCPVPLQNAPDIQKRVLEISCSDLYNSHLFHIWSAKIVNLFVKFHGRARGTVVDRRGCDLVLQINNSSKRELPDFGNGPRLHWFHRALHGDFVSQDLLDFLGKSDPEGHGESKSELDLSFWVYSPSILESEVDTYPKDPGVWFVLWRSMWAGS